MRKSLALGAALALAASGAVTLSTAGSAAAANGFGQGTPGSACTLRIGQLDLEDFTTIEVDYPGTVDNNDVRGCVPNSPLRVSGFDILAGTCNTAILVALGLSVGDAICPS